MSDLSDAPAGCSGESIALPLKSVNVKQRNHILSFTPISKRLTSNPTKLVYYFKNRKNILWAMVKIFSGSCIVTLVVAFGFLPKILGGGGDLRMYFVVLWTLPSPLLALKSYLVKLPHDLINLNDQNYPEKVTKISQYSALTDEQRWAFQELTTNAT